MFRQKKVSNFCTNREKVVFLHSHYAHISRRCAILCAIHPHSSDMSYTNPILALEKQKQLLGLEYEAEREAFRVQTEARGIGRIMKRGDAWWPVVAGKMFYNSLNQCCLSLSRSTELDIEHNFEFSRPVTFFTLSSSPATAAGSKPHYLNVTATVSYAEEKQRVVALRSEGDAALLQQTEGLGVQLSFDETSYRCMLDALNRVIEGRGTRLSHLRDVCYTDIPLEHYTFGDIRLPWLNASQEHAVNEVLRAKDVAIVHGPPGTGKTTTLVEAVVECLQRENQVLVCAQSNMAVDWISEKLVDRGVPVLRVGNPTRVNDKMLGFTYERLFEAHGDYPELWSLRKTLRELRRHRRRGDRSWHDKVDRLRSRATELEAAIHQQLFSNARVIACTLVGAAHRLLDGQTFGTLFIDEAAQALEAACWIPMRRASRVVLAGDHCQLPPTIKSHEALRGGLGVTLMQRIAERRPGAVTMLTMQYRMHDDIMRFSSQWFYDGKVVSAPEVSHRSILDYDIPMLWIDTSDMACREEFVGESYGRVNKTEARLTLAALQLYIEKIGLRRAIDESIDIGIISPYRAQVQHLRQLLKKEEYFRPLRHNISVNTVDGFQGQERDIILISLVRANDEGQIGFLSDIRRMNVAITRARMKLIILGDAPTMTRHKFYKALYDYIESI